MLVFLLHSMKLLFTKPIPPNPAPSKIIPIISETLYIYLIGFQDGFEFVRGEQSVGMTAVGLQAVGRTEDFKQPNNAQGAGLVERMQGNHEGL